MFYDKLFTIECWRLPIFKSRCQGTIFVLLLWLKRIILVTVRKVNMTAAKRGYQVLILRFGIETD